MIETLVLATVKADHKGTYTVEVVVPGIGLVSSGQAEILKLAVGNAVKAAMDNQPELLKPFTTSLAAKQKETLPFRELMKGADTNGKA